MNHNIYRVLLLVVSPIWFLGVLFTLILQVRDSSQTVIAIVAVPAITLGLLPVFLAWRYRKDVSTPVKVSSKTLLFVVLGAVGGFTLLVLAVMILLPGA